MNSGDSKKLWLSIINDFEYKKVTLGDYASYDYLHDPKRLLFVASRYKFCARMLENYENVLEIGCGDGFGSAIVGSAVNNLICTDINEEMVRENGERNDFLKNVSYTYHDFRSSAFEKKVDAIYLLDVIEHIYPEEEEDFMNNIVKSLNKNGVLIIGTPNEAAKEYASENALKQHINLKDCNSLKSLSDKYFNNVFMFSMNDEVVHTGFHKMGHYLFTLCVGPKLNTEKV